MTDSSRRSTESRSAHTGSATATDSDPFRISYELRIGVTGHRSGFDAVRVRAAVKALLDGIDGSLYHQDRVPLEWTVVTSLAAGADGIVAREVLGRPNACMEVILPLAESEYRKDFREPSALAEFDELLKLARRREVPDADDCLRYAQTPDGRNEGYLRAGKRVVDECEILIAVWDGLPPRGKGGTADVVQYALRCGRPVLWIDTRHPDLMPQLLTLPNPAQAPTESFSVAAVKRHPVPRAAKYLSPGYHRLASFTRDRSFDRENHQVQLDAESLRIRELARRAGLDERRLEPILRDVVPNYVRADQLAAHYQRLHVCACKAAFFLAATAVSVAMFQVQFFPAHTWIILFELFAMGAAVYFYIQNLRHAWHEKWLHDRYLSEQLRMATIIAALGEDPAPVFVAARTAIPYYVEPQKWLTTLLLRIVSRGTSDVRALQSAELKSAQRFAVEGWLREQSQWHARNAHRRERPAVLAHNTIVCCFVATLVAASLHLLGVGHGDGEGHAGGWAGRGIAFLAVVLPAWAAATHGYSRQMEFERVAHRSEQMSRLLAYHADRVEESENIDELRHAISKAAQVTALEAYEWWVLLSFDKPELVV